MLYRWLRRDWLTRLTKVTRNYSINEDYHRNFIPINVIPLTSTGLSFDFSFPGVVVAECADPGVLFEALSSTTLVFFVDVFFFFFFFFFLSSSSSPKSSTSSAELRSPTFLSFVCCPSDCEFIKFMSAESIFNKMKFGFWKNLIATINMNSGIHQPGTSCESTAASRWTMRHTQTLQACPQWACGKVTSTSFGNISPVALETKFSILDRIIHTHISWKFILLYNDFVFSNWMLNRNMRNIWKTSK